MSINNKMKMINDKIRIKHIQNKFLNSDNNKGSNTGIDINKIKEKYISEVHNPLFMSSYHYITKSKPSKLVVQSLIQKYKSKPQDSQENDINNACKTFRYTPRPNKRYDHNSQNYLYYSPVHEVNVQYNKTIPIYQKVKQNSLNYINQPKPQLQSQSQSQLTNEICNHSVPYLDITSAMKNTVYPLHRYYPSQRGKTGVYDEDIKPQFNSAQISFRSEYNTNTSSLEHFGISPIKQRINWLQKEKKNIRLKINSYSNTNSPTKEVYNHRKREKDKIENREQVDSYLNDFFNENEQCNLESLSLLNPVKMPNLLHRSVLKINLPSFNAIE